MVPPRPLRVLHVLDHSLPMHSGYTFRTRAILKAQIANGIEVRAITGLRHTAAGPDAEEIEGLRFQRTRGAAGTLSGLREMGEIRLLADAIVAAAGDWRPDVIHAHSPALCGHAALRAGRRLGIKVVYEIRAFWEDAAVANGATRAGSLRYRLTRALEDEAVQDAGAVVTICAGLRDDLEARGHDGARIAIVPNGVDLALFGTPPARDEALAASLNLGLNLGPGLDPDGDGRTGDRTDPRNNPKIGPMIGPVIGFIGSFYDYEGLDDLIGAMPALIGHHPGARLLLVGGGPMEEALRRQAEASPAAAAIRFAGRVPHAEVERYYALCDIMAYPRKASRLTGLVTPLKPLEAMAQGRLVAASDIGGHRELIEHGRTGVLFAPDDPLACARALAGLLASPGRWPAMRAAGRDHVASRHDWRTNALRYHSIYQTLLGFAPISHRAGAG